MLIGAAVLFLFFIIGIGSHIAGDQGGQDSLAASLPGDVTRWVDSVKEWADYFSLPWRIILAQLWQESGGNPDVIGSAGEKGLMQIKQIAVDDLRQNGYSVPDDWFNNAKHNIRVGAAYLDLQLERTGNIRDALKAYNQGLQGMKDNPALARMYADKVIAKAKKMGYNV